MTQVVQPRLVAGVVGATDAGMLTETAEAARVGQAHPCAVRMVKNGAAAVRDRVEPPAVRRMRSGRDPVPGRRGPAGSCRTWSGEL